MIECYKCEWSHILKMSNEATLLKTWHFVLCCDRFRDLTDLDYQIPECKEYKERPEIDW